MAVTGGWLRNSTGKVNAGKLYGRKSEKSGRLSKRRDDDDRSSGKDNFDGTPGSDKGPASDVKGTDSGDASSPNQGTEDTVKALQRKLLRRHPGSEMKIERIDYSKAAAYTDSPTYHMLEEYYKLPEGAYFVTRNGETDKNYVKVILFLLLLWKSISMKPRRFVSVTRMISVPLTRYR